MLVLIEALEPFEGESRRMTTTRVDAGPAIICIHF